MPEKASMTADKNIVERPVRRKRSDAMRTVEDLRRQLASGKSGKIAFERELTENFAINHLNAAYALPIFVLMIAVVAANWIGTYPAVVWFTMTVGAYALLLVFCHRYLRERQDDEFEVSGWRRIFVLAQLMIAGSWLLFAIYRCNDCGGDNTYPIMQFAALLVLIAITSMLSYNMRAGSLIVTLPAVLWHCGRLFLMAEPAPIAMGVILIGALAFFFYIAQRLNLSMVSMLEYQAEKDNFISELETAKAFSEEARRRAEDANLAKSRFLATMSHELRTPLNAILGFSEVIKTEAMGPIGNKLYKEYVSDIHASGAHLLNVINEILDLSRVEAGRYEFAEEAVKLVHVAEQASGMLQLKIRAKDIRLITQYEDNLPQIWADERAVRQVMINLLSNAVKFTPNNGSIWFKVGWTRSGGQYLQVKDNGPGISEEEIPVVLSSFGQGAIAIKSAEQGTGLGLPIVQELVKMHGGRFDLSSKLRQGTVVTVSFPRNRVLEAMLPVPGTASVPKRANSGLGRSIDQARGAALAAAAGQK